MKPVLARAALPETATGAALLIVPSLVGRLLLGENLVDSAQRSHASRALR
jgi:hypothetical protein